MARFRQKNRFPDLRIALFVKNEKGMIPVSAKIYFCEKAFPPIIIWDHIQMLHILSYENNLIIINYNTSR